MLDKSALNVEHVMDCVSLPEPGGARPDKVIPTDVLFLRRMIQEAREDLERSREMNTELVHAIRNVCESLDGLAKRYHSPEGAERLS